MLSVFNTLKTYRCLTTNKAKLPEVEPLMCELSKGPYKQPIISSCKSDSSRTRHRLPSNKWHRTNAHAGNAYKIH